MVGYWARWCTKKQGQTSAIFVGQLGHGFASRFVCCSVLSYLSRKGFRSDAGAVADLKTSRPDKGSTVLYHSCRWMQSSVALHRHSLLLLCSRQWTQNARAFSHACPADKLLIHSLGKKATAPFPVQVLWHFQWQELGGGRSFYMYTQIINNDSIIPRRTPVSNHIS